MYWETWIIDNIEIFFDALILIHLQKGVECVDTSNGATDDAGFNCSFYIETPGYCGMNDDLDFKAKDMCCACKLQNGTIRLTVIKGWFYN